MPSKKTTVSDRMIKVSDIVGMDVIASRTGTSPHAVWNWTKRYDFPERITTVSGKPAFDWNEVEKWEQNWVRSKGGYHTHKSKDVAAKKMPAKKAAPAVKKTAVKAAVKSSAGTVKKVASKRTVTRSPMARARRTS